ncbi:hypothetical protein [Vibrio sp. HN007]|uniref:hypothetical protein n=1 Tax=Vibrio iocasae TaxID=3098914 RepID=UPI0035D3ECF8
MKLVTSLALLTILNYVINANAAPSKINILENCDFDSNGIIGSFKKTGMSWKEWDNLESELKCQDDLKFSEIPKKVLDECDLNRNGKIDKAITYMIPLLKQKNYAHPNLALHDVEKSTRNNLKAENHCMVEAANMALAKLKAVVSDLSAIIVNLDNKLKVMEGGDLSTEALKYDLSNLKELVATAKYARQEASAFKNYSYLTFADTVIIKAFTLEIKTSAALIKSDTKELIGVSPKLKSDVLK